MDKLVAVGVDTVPSEGVVQGGQAEPSGDGVLSGCTVIQSGYTHLSDT